jgi:hypothetical protein
MSLPTLQRQLADIRAQIAARRQVPDDRHDSERVTIWIPDDGRNAPPPPVEQQLAEGQRVIIYRPEGDER